MPLRETPYRLADHCSRNPTVVNDYWEKGGVGLLSSLARCIDVQPHGFVVQLLAFRRRLLPVIAELAVKEAPEGVLPFLTRNFSASWPTKPATPSTN